MYVYNMYVCMYVGMDVCMYVCVCMYTCISILHNNVSVFYSYLSVVELQIAYAVTS